MPQRNRQLVESTLHRFLALKLKTRIAVAMLALVSIASISVALIAQFAGERLEENVNYDLLAEELTHYEQRLRVEPSAAPLMSASLHIYRSINMAELPREFAQLRPGIHRATRRDGREFRILVRDSEFGRLYITYDVTEHDRAQRIAMIVLVAAVVAILLLTTWAAFALAQPLLAPVNRLADKLSQMDPSVRKTRFAADFAGNELEPIARSIDTFLERLDGFVAREQAFTSTASHELRTPLAVIQGAVELLSEQYAQQPGSTKALDRIQRAVREMSEFTSALLSLARETDRKNNTETDCDIGALLARIVEELQLTSAQKKITYSIEGPPFAVRAPDSMVAMIVGNLIRNAVQHGVGNIVNCRLSGNILAVTNEGSIAEHDLPHLFQAHYTTRAGGHGMGLYLAQRISERYGWRIDIGSSSDTTVAKVEFLSAPEQSAEHSKAPSPTAQ